MPHVVRYTGTLPNVLPGASAATVRFSAYAVRTGGEPLWSEEQAVTLDSAGKYSVLLGGVTPLPDALFAAGEARWIGVSVAGSAESARTSLAASAYALKSQDAETLGGHPVSDFELASPKVKPDGSTPVTQINTASGILGAGTGPTVSLTADPAYFNTYYGQLAAANAFTATNSFAKPIVSTVATGTAPFTIASTTAVPNLDASLLGGAAAAAFPQLALQNTFTNNQIVGPSAPATTSTGHSSYFLWLNASVYNSSKGAAQNIGFQWRAEPLANNTASPNANFALLSTVTSATPQETGFKITANGVVTFVAAQTFPGAAELGAANTFTQTQTIDTSAGDGLDTSASGKGKSGVSSYASAGPGVLGSSDGTGAAGVYGSSSAGDGIEGYSTAAGYSGVHGISTVGYGVLGLAQANGFSGVYGASTAAGDGVTGTATSGNGVSGSIGSSGYAGVSGSNTAGNGVAGNSTASAYAGVSGSNTAGNGVAGSSTASGYAGVAGTSAVGYGVSGSTTAASYVSAVYGLNNGPGAGIIDGDTAYATVGEAVRGFSTSSTSIGVHGIDVDLSVTGGDFQIEGAGVWADTSAPSQSGKNSGALLATADDNNAGNFNNNSNSSGTLMLYNQGTGGTSTTAAVPVLSASGRNGACGINSTGDVHCTGRLASVVTSGDSSKQVEVYSVQSAENWFEDFGSARLGNGVAHVTIEPEFAKTVNTGVDFHVFVTPEGNCKGLYIASKTKDGFDVRELQDGTSSVAFDYRVVAKRNGHESERLMDAGLTMHQLTDQRDRVEARKAAHKAAGSSR